MFNWQYSTFSEVDDAIAKHFPFKTPRADQLETITEIKNAINNGYRYIILEAGTGTGKSAIAATLSQMHDSSYILTVTKQLQNQYLSDFTDLGFKLVKGRSNFHCKKYSGHTCDEGMCVLEGRDCEFSLKNRNDKITRQNTCPYYYQKYLALNAKTVISNYPYMFLELNYVNDFSKRNLLICDEAHNLESTLMSQLTLEFEKGELDEYVGIKLDDDTLHRLDGGDYSDWIVFVLKIQEKYQKELERIINIKKPELMQKVSFMKKQINDCSRFVEHITYDPESWIFDYDSEYEIAQFKPLKIDSYAKDTLFRHADVCIFMSATILDYRLFSRWLGISNDEIYPIRRKSPFDVKRNPIKTYSDYDLSRKYIEKNAPKTIDTVRLILENHKTDKGIIHTVSGRCRDFLMESIKDPRLITHTTRDRADVLKMFRQSDEPLVLVSPSMGEGVDLPGDLSRFQIMYKIPYPDLGDRQTAIRSRIDPDWFDYRTALALVQTYGRGMRYADDHCRTYFIDNRLKQFVKRDLESNNFLTEPFRNAIDTTALKIESEDMDYFDTKKHKEKLEVKYRLTKRANQFLEDGNFEGAIRFYRSLTNHELFINDYHPYRKLARAYHGAGLYEKETETIVEFFKSGRYCKASKLKWFFKRLEELSNRGYFDKSLTSELEAEYRNNGAKNRVLSNQPLPTAVEVRRIVESENILKYPPEYFDEVCRVPLNLDYDGLVSFKYRLYQYGKKLIDEDTDKAIAFYTRLKNHELFINDYYPFRKLATLFRKKRQYSDASDVIAEFFASGRYCDKKQFRWFLKQLEDMSKYGNFDMDEIDDLKEEFFKKGAKNKSESNRPVPTVARIKKLNETKVNHLKSDDYIKQYYRNLGN